MVMRYHCGLAAGHIYAHPTGDADQRLQTENTRDTSVIQVDEAEGLQAQHEVVEHGNKAEDGDDPELSMENREDDLIYEGEPSEDGQDRDSDDDEFLAMDNMYGCNYD